MRFCPLATVLDGTRFQESAGGTCYDGWDQSPFSMKHDAVGRHIMEIAVKHRRRPGDSSGRPVSVPGIAGGGNGRQVRHGLLLGVVSGLAAIGCCVSPVVLALLGVATAAQAVTLGDTLYYEYGWFFRAAGIGIAAVAVILYLRRNMSCNLRGANRYRRMLLTLLLSGSVTYVGLFWFTKLLAVWSG